MTTSPVAEEAARLVEALQEWFAGAGGGLPIATGSAECALCPFCQLLHLAKTARPEVFEHLAGAGMELAAAVRAGVEGRERAARARRGGVQHIDVDD